MRTPLIFISHTTNDPRDFELAQQLANSLSALGAQVWIAPESIPTGAAWKKEIVRSIMESSTHFVVLVSAASIASPWVLDEIELARARREHNPQFRIIPLILGTVGDFRGRDVIDSVQHAPYRSSVAAQVHEIARAVGLRLRIPVPFETLIREKTERFVGREYVFDAIARFVAQSPRGYFVIEGEPGAGKTSIAAELVRRGGYVAHFNMQSQAITSERKFLESVCAQLSERFGFSWTGLPLDAANDGATLARTLEQVAGEITDGEHCVLVVDGLDEVEPDGPVSANVLFLPESVPNGIYLILTRRSGAQMRLVIDTAQQYLDLRDFATATLDDVRLYVRRSLDREGIAAWIAAQNTTAGEFVERIAAQSEENFMYVKYVLDDIDRGAYAQMTLGGIPQGLRGYYEDHWRRMGMAARPLPRVKTRILYVLAEVRRPVTRDLMAKLLGEDALTVQETIDDWRQFLRAEAREDGATRYSLYHTSFRDFLHRKDIIASAGLTLRDVHARIADSFLAEL